MSYNLLYSLKQTNKCDDTPAFTDNMSDDEYAGDIDDGDFAGEDIDGEDIEDAEVEEGAGGEDA